MELRGKRVVVVGLARSGVAAARELVARGALVTALDRKRAAELGAEAMSLQAMGVTLRLGGEGRDAARQDQDALRQAELIVVSPGVPWMLGELVAARAAVPMIGELELAARLLRGTIAAITGTKGKSTTTAALGAMLRAGRERADVRVGGNIGNALSELIAGSTDETLFVVEASSFQLQATSDFHPRVAVFLNLTPDHLDQHRDFDEYRGAKARIFANQQPSDFAVVNADDAAVLLAARAGRARIATFTDAGTPPPAGSDGAWFDGDRAMLRLRGAADEELFLRSSLRLRGSHLALDLLAAAVAARILGTAPADIASAVADFRGAQHVLEDAGTLGAVAFVNDSKATNIAAAKRSLEAFDGPLALILGGRHKGGDFAELRPYLERADRTVIAIGEARVRIVADLGKSAAVVAADSMAEAVRLGYDALRRAGSGGTVLLAPACSSFDMFNDYAARGRAFKDAVAALREAHRHHG